MVEIQRRAFSALPLMDFQTLREAAVGVGAPLTDASDGGPGSSSAAARRRLAPTQLVQPVFRQTEVMPDLVYESGADLGS